MSSSDAIHRCRVCARIQESPPWGLDQDTPSYLICACCGTEFGVDDCRFSEVLDRRNRWVSSGANWFQPKDRPELWDYREQLRGLDEEWTIEGLGLDDDDTPAEDTEPPPQVWQPEYVDYHHYASGATLPSLQQTEAFAKYLIDLFSSRFHASLFPPGLKFVFFLRPYAGSAFRANGSLGTARPYPIASCAESLATDEYQKRFGDWDYYVETPWCINTQIHGLVKESSLLEPYARNGTCHLTGFLNDNALIENADVARQDCAEYVARNVGRTPSWKRLLSRFMGSKSECNRYRYLVNALEKSERDAGERVQLDAGFVARECRIQRERLRTHLHRVREFYHQRRQLTVDEFWSNRNDIIHDIAENSSRYFIDNGSVLGPEDPFGGVLGLVDEEYGWPVSMELNKLPDPAEWMNRPRCHPFIVEKDKCLAVCIQLSDYADLIQKAV